MKVFHVHGDISDHAMVDCGLGEAERSLLLQQVLRIQSLTSCWREIVGRKVGKLPFGNFAYCNLSSAMPIVFPMTLNHDRVGNYLADIGEQLPIRIGDIHAFVWNVTRECDACDLAKSRVLRLPKADLTDYPVFKRSALPRSGFFRIKQAWNRLYLVEPEDDTGFHRWYFQEKLTGLIFDERPISDE